MGNKKKAKKTKVKKQYPTNVDGRAKEAMAIQPPDVNEHKMDNENFIDKFLRFRPRYEPNESIKVQSRKKK
ncbi:hypothetical protein H6503_03670 [Candidatus Woesearchaeota archaeon]|nr:hypothetical protein [Candidatus Woesearchaeota archaeon]